ncbi:hypothetical protein ACFFX0_22250 [Citricoccus parietis]|uniref:Uncharacterized protein n=1 Tax=Citricoccus parietis TaxID=592307 RepID=A0ABV5G4B1_9MICC
MRRSARLRCVGLNPPRRTPITGTTRNRPHRPRSTPWRTCCWSWSRPAPIPSSRPIPRHPGQGVQGTPRQAPSAVPHRSCWTG